MIKLLLSILLTSILFACSTLNKRKNLEEGHDKTACKVLIKRYLPSDNDYTYDSELKVKRNSIPEVCSEEEVKNYLIREACSKQVDMIYIEDEKYPSAENPCYGCTARFYRISE